MKKLFILSAVLGALVYLGVLKNPFAGKPDFVNGYVGEVVLYATAWCGYCEKTRALLKEHNIRFIEHDIEQSAVGREQYQQLEGKGVPLLLVDMELVRGYNPDKITGLLAKMQ